MLVEMLRAARKKAGLSQVEASDRLGCRQTFLSKIECGERRLDLVEFVVLCHAYKVDPRTLFKEFVTKSFPVKPKRRFNRPRKKK